MKSPNATSRKSFDYSHDRKRTTIVTFDIVTENGMKVATNITLTSNWRVYYPKNPQIGKDKRGEYGFVENGCYATNGDIQQMIKRIHSIVEESIK